jgi:diketogulonate reductase-like aldo/keto reductase
VSHLALAWIVKRSANTGTVIFGATNPEQVVDNLKAIDVLPKLTPQILTKIEKILNNRPPAIVRCFPCFIRRAVSDKLFVYREPLNVSCIMTNWKRSL